MSEISKLLSESQNPQARLMKETRGLVSKWEKTGLLEGIKTDTEKSGMSILLENQAKQLIDESSRTGTGGGNEEWSGVALPLVRRVFAEIASKEFVSVQPMNLPSGLIFYLDFKYGSTQQAGKLHAKDSDLHGNTSSSGDPAGGLYGAGKWGYSINDVSATVGYTSTTASMADVRFDPNLSASAAAEGLNKIEISGSQLTNPDLEGVKAFAINGTYGAYTAPVSRN